MTDRLKESWGGKEAESIWLIAHKGCFSVSIRSMKKNVQIQIRGADERGSTLVQQAGRAK